ncbi:MAG: hypothetical protein FWH42_03285 [Dehalococcoidia bacterium]|nr:hypothetical protein [Dehalococcoidia bacterium]
METKEEYYQRTHKSRQITADANLLKCICPSEICDWKGGYKECVTIHRYKRDPLLVCLQPLISDKVEALAAMGELLVSEKECTPAGYRLYVFERDEENE